jgi:sortase A
MVLYAYIKAPPGKGKFFIKKKVFFAKLKNISPFFFVLTGIICLSFVPYSIFSYKILVFEKLREEIIAPISEIKIAEAQGLVNPLVAGVSDQAAETSSLSSQEQIDYDLINNWFPTAPLLPVKPSKITHYTLSIPKLRIKSAVVEIGGTKVKDHLIHYPGTALPGEFGNTVIFGHSILPIFYNPEDYKSIFSLLPTLNKQDKIYISFDGIEYLYEVVSYREVKPAEISVLEQRFDQQTLSLVTCVPPGTYLRRGIIKARLVSI